MRIKFIPGSQGFCLTLISQPSVYTSIMLYSSLDNDTLLSSRKVQLGASELDFGNEM